jgi:drug/metabolite transporter (DMT)-like permease
VIWTRVDRSCGGCARMVRQTLPVRRLLLLSFIWGWSFLFIKVAVEGLTPTTVAWGRISLGAVALYLILRHQGRCLETNPVFVRHFAVMALVASVVPFTLLAWGEQRITSALTAVLNASTPLFTALFAGIAGQERLRPLQALGLGVGVVGVAVAAGLGAADVQGSSIAGALAAIGAGACYGMGLVYSRRHLMVLPPLVAAAGQLAAGAVILAPLALATSVTSGFALTPSRAVSMLLLGVFGTGVAYLIFYGLIADLGPTKTSIVTYLVPVVAVMAGIVVLDEPFEWRLIVGGVVTVSGVAAVSSKRGARGEEPDDVAAGAGATEAVPTASSG